MAQRTEYSWDRLAMEAAARMAEHDALPKELRDMANEHGLAAAREALAEKRSGDFMAMFS